MSENRPRELAARKSSASYNVGKQHVVRHKDKTGATYAPQATTPNEAVLGDPPYKRSALYRHPLFRGRDEE